MDVAVTANPDEWHHEPTGRTIGLSIGTGGGHSRVEFEWPSWHHQADHFYSPKGQPTTIHKERRLTQSLDVLYQHEYEPDRRVLLSWLVGGGYAMRVSHETTEVRAPAGDV